MQNEEENSTELKYFGNKVPSYEAVISSKRSNAKLNDFSFDVNLFEDLIDSFVPEDKLPILLQTNTGELDRFCYKVYNMPYHETFLLLSGITDVACRKMFKNLAATGNTTALGIISKHFMGLRDEEQKSNVSVTFVNDLNSKDSKDKE